MLGKGTGAGSTGCLGAKGLVGLGVEGTTGLGVKVVDFDEEEDVEDEEAEADFTDEPEVAEDAPAEANTEEEPEGESLEDEDSVAEGGAGVVPKNSDKSNEMDLSVLVASVVASVTEAEGAVAGGEIKEEKMRLLDGVDRIAALADRAVLKDDGIPEDETSAPEVEVVVAEDSTIDGVVELPEEATDSTTDDDELDESGSTSTAGRVSCDDDSTLIGLNGLYFGL